MPESTAPTEALASSTDVLFRLAAEAKVLADVAQALDTHLSDAAMAPRRDVAGLSRHLQSLDALRQGLNVIAEISARLAEHQKRGGTGLLDLHHLGRGVVPRHLRDRCLFGSDAAAPSTGKPQATGAGDFIEF